MVNIMIKIIVALSLKIKLTSVSENLSSMFVNNKGTDQPVHLRILMSAFGIHFFESIISKLATNKFLFF